MPFGGGLGASLEVQLVKNPPAMQETRVRSLGREDPLEKEMAALSNILAWEIPWTKKPGRLQSMELQMNQTRLCGYTATITFKIIPPSYIIWILTAVYKPPKSITAESSLLLLSC